MADVYEVAVMLSRPLVEAVLPYVEGVWSVKDGYTFLAVPPIEI